MDLNQVHVAQTVITVNDEGLDCAPADVWQDLQTGILPDTRHTDRPCQADQCSSKLMQCIADTD